MDGTKSTIWRTGTTCILLAACSATPRDISTGEQVLPDDAAAITDAAAQVNRDVIAFDCSVIAPTSCPDPPLHYPDVAPIFHERCSAVCHSGTVDGPWPLTSYQHVADWWDVIRDDMFTCAMPPADAGVPMTTDERLAILTWIRCGFPP